MDGNVVKAVFQPKHKDRETFLRLFHLIWRKDARKHNNEQDVEGRRVQHKLVVAVRVLERDVIPFDELVQISVEFKHGLFLHSCKNIGENGDEIVEHKDAGDVDMNDDEHSM